MNATCSSVSTGSCARAMAATATSSGEVTDSHFRRPGTARSGCGRRCRRFCIRPRRASRRCSSTLGSTFCFVTSSLIPRRSRLVLGHSCTGTPLRRRLREHSEHALGFPSAMCAGWDSSVAGAPVRSGSHAAPRVSLACRRRRRGWRRSEHMCGRCRSARVPSARSSTLYWSTPNLWAAPSAVPGGLPIRVGRCHCGGGLVSRKSFERSIRLSLAVRHWAVTAWIIGTAVAFVVNHVP